MKKFAILAAALVVGLSASSALACQDGACTDPSKCVTGSVSKVEGQDPMAGAHACAIKTQLVVKGMKCSNCVSHVTQALKGVKGVEAVNVNLEAGTAEVAYCPDELKSTEPLIKAVKTAGYIAEAPKAAAPKAAAPAKK